MNFFLFLEKQKNKILSFKTCYTKLYLYIFEKLLHSCVDDNSFIYITKNATKYLVWKCLTCVFVSWTSIKNIDWNLYV